MLFSKPEKGEHLTSISSRVLAAQSEVTGELLIGRVPLLLAIMNRTASMASAGVVCVGFCLGRNSGCYRLLQRSFGTEDLVF